MTVKSGHKTTEFLFTALVAIGSVAAALAGDLSPRYAALASAVSAAAYAISRAITKNGVASSPTTVVTTSPVTTNAPPPGSSV